MVTFLSVLRQNAWCSNWRKEGFIYSLWMLQSVLGWLHCRVVWLRVSCSWWLQQRSKVTKAKGQKGGASLFLSLKFYTSYLPQGRCSTHTPCPTVNNEPITILDSATLKVSPLPWPHEALGGYIDKNSNIDLITSEKKFSHYLLNYNFSLSDSYLLFWNSNCVH